MTPRLGLTALAVAIALAFPVAQDRPLFSTVSELIVLHVTVKDHRGAYVRGLSQDAFALTEEGEPQEIRLFTTQDAPVTIGLLLDASGSMQPKLSYAIAAAGAFVNACNREDDVFGLAFNEEIRTMLPADAPFTNDPVVLRQAFRRHTIARGRTGLFDAVVRGLDYVSLGHHERKVLVVVSDGGDNASRTTMAELLTRTQASNVVVYAISLVDREDREANPKALARIAESSGGEALRPRSLEAVEEAMLHIARDIRNAYTIGYASTNISRDTAFRRIRVVVQQPGGKGLVVRTRAGYVAGGS